MRKKGENSGKRRKNWEKEGKNREKRKEIVKKRENWEGSFILPLLTERAGYATVFFHKGSKGK